MLFLDALLLKIPAEKSRESRLAFPKACFEVTGVVSIVSWVGQTNLPAFHPVVAFGTRLVTPLAGEPMLAVAVT